MSFKFSLVQQKITSVGHPVRIELTWVVIIHKINLLTTVLQ